MQIGHNGSSRASAPPAIIPETPATRRGSFPQINHFLQLSMKQGNRPKCTAALARPFFTFRPSAANYLSSSVVIFNFAVPDITSYHASVSIVKLLRPFRRFSGSFRTVLNGRQTINRKPGSTRMDHDRSDDLIRSPVSICSGSCAY